VERTIKMAWDYRNLRLDVYMDNAPKRSPNPLGCFRYLHRIHLLDTMQSQIST